MRPRSLAPSGRTLLALAVVGGLAVVVLIILLLALRRTKKQPAALSAVPVRKQDHPIAVTLAETIMQRPAAWYVWVEKGAAGGSDGRPVAIERFEIQGSALPFSLWAQREEEQAEAGREDGQSVVLANLTPQPGKADAGAAESNGEGDQAGPVVAPPSATRPSHLMAADRWLFVWHGEAAVAASKPRVSVSFADPDAAM